MAYAMPECLQLNWNCKLTVISKCWGVRGYKSKQINDSIIIKQTRRFFSINLISVCLEYMVVKFVIAPKQYR